MQSGKNVFALLATGVAWVFGAQSYAGTITNGSFESGLTGWMATPSALVSTPTQVNAFGESGTVYKPTSGSHFGYLLAGSGAGRYTMLSQMFTADAGQVLKFDTFFDSGDATNADNAFDTIVGLNDDGSTLNEQVFSSKGGSTAGGGIGTGSTGWKSISYTFQEAGTFQLVAEVRNVGNNLTPSALGVDNVALVPLPSSALAGLALLSGIGGWKLKQRRALPIG